MAEELTLLVHSILQHGIRLKTRLVRGEPLILENEQALLKKMLLSETREAMRRGPISAATRRSAPGEARCGSVGPGLHRLRRLSRDPLRDGLLA